MKIEEYPDYKDVAVTIERFRSFLNSSWATLTEVLEKHDWDDDAYFLEDWLNANWDLLVCRQLLGKNGKLQPFAVATNCIEKGRFSHYLESKGDHKIFVSLGSCKKDFEVTPPFDKVKVISKSGLTEVLPWTTLRFELRANL